MHLLVLVERRDIWSLRDLQKRHIPWLEHMRQKVLEATVQLYPELELDQIKLYMHCKYNVLFSYIRRLRRLLLRPFPFLASTLVALLSVESCRYPINFLFQERIRPSIIYQGRCPAIPLRRLRTVVPQISLPTITFISTLLTWHESPTQVKRPAKHMG